MRAIALSLLTVATAAALAGCDAARSTAVGSGSSKTTAATADEASAPLPPSRQALAPRHVVNALYVSVLDDEDLPRFAPPQRGELCGPDTQLSIDGAPVVEGQAIPGPVFTLRWEIDGCQPLGDTGPLLAGRYDVLVMHDDEHGPGAVLLAHDALFIAYGGPLHQAHGRNPQ